MPPIRRYLRITQYSVLEVRIYLDQPSDQAWLLSSRDDVLARIIAEVRPKVLPKLREENENARKKGAKGKKAKGIKDVASQEDFEVTIFLTELSTRHSLLTKKKGFTEKARLQSTGTRLTGGDGLNPIAVDDEEDTTTVVRQEEDEVDVQELHSVPVRGRGDERKATARAAGDEDEDEDGLFVSSSDEDFFQTQRERRTKSRRKVDKPNDRQEAESERLPEVDDKKKLAINTSYDGFSIYGRILCLVVKRKGKRAGQSSTSNAAVGGSQMMEQWVSTQAAQENGLDEND